MCVCVCVCVCLMWKQWNQEEFDRNKRLFMYYVHVSFLPAVGWRASVWWLWCFLCDCDFSVWICSVKQSRRRLWFNLNSLFEHKCFVFASFCSSAQRIERNSPGILGRLCDQMVRPLWHHNVDSILLPGVIDDLSAYHKTQKGSSFHKCLFSSSWGLTLLFDFNGATVF